MSYLLTKIDNDSVKELGEYQIEWLNKYSQINLREWRCENVNNVSEWFYVGKSININNHERRENLKMNPYYYWPG